MAAPGQTLKALVRDELRGPVSELVRQVVVELVHEELTAAAPVATEAPQSTNGATPSSKTCRTCGIESPLINSPQTGACAGPAGASRIWPGKRSASNADVSSAHTRQATTTRRAPEPAPPPSRRPSPPRRNGYRLEAGIYGRLRDERRAMIEAAPATTEERDGRVWVIKRLPSVSD